MRPVQRPDEMVGSGSAAPSAGELEFDFCLAENEQTSHGSVPRQGERRLFDFGADEPWEPPANGPTAALPPWMKPPATESAVAGPTVEVEESAAVVPTQVAHGRRRRPEPIPIATDVPVPIPAPAVLDKIVERPIPVPVAPPTSARPAPRVAAAAVAPSAPPTPARAHEDRLDQDPLDLPPVPRGRDRASTQRVRASVLTVPSDNVRPVPPPTPVRAVVTTEPRRRRRSLRIGAPSVVLGLLATVGGIGLFDRAPVTAPLAAAAVQARDWILANVDLSISVLAPQTTARDLTAHGLEDDRVVGYGDGPSQKIDASCCSFLVVSGDSAEKAVAALPRDVRKAYDRSRPAAVFDADGHHAEVRQILDLAPGKVAGAVASDRRILAAAGRELADNDRLKLGDRARAGLIGGDVDPRLTVAVASVTGAHTLTVSEFPQGPGEAGTGAWRRSVAITKIDGRSFLPDSLRVKKVQELLAAQKAPNRPAATTVTRDGNVGTLTITFRAPSPLGLSASMN